MNAQSLRLVSHLKRKSQSDLARMAGVSRQAVSHWFQSLGHEELHIRSPHLKKLAEALRIKADDLLYPLPLLDDLEATRKFETLLLWDRLYPDLGEFAVAVVREELPALARLTQSFGLYRAAKIAGPAIFGRFQEFKHHLRPARREELERIWKFRESK